MPLPEYANIRENHEIKIYNKDGTYEKFFATKDLTQLENGKFLEYIKINRIEKYDLIKEVD